MVKATHLHKYKKINIATGDKKYPVYKCVKPGCSHYIPIVQAAGVICECIKCGDMLVIGKVQLFGSGGRPMTNVRCVNCIKRKTNVQNLELVEKFLKEQTKE